MTFIISLKKESPSQNLKQNTILYRDIFETSKRTWTHCYTQYVLMLFLDFAGSPPSAGQLLPMWPCGNQDQSFTESYLNSFSWHFASFSKCWIWHIHSHYKSPRFVLHLQLQLAEKVLYHCREVGRKEEGKKMPSQGCDFFRVSFIKSWSLKNYDKMKSFASGYLWEIRIYWQQLPFSHPPTKTYTSSSASACW